MATDGALTFAILNYGRVDPDYSRNNSLVGVNAGDGANFHTHPNSMTTDIYNIESEPGNTGELGQWVYRVDVISNETESIPGDSLQLDEGKCMVCIQCFVYSYNSNLCMWQNTHPHFYQHSIHCQFTKATNFYIMHVIISCDFAELSI